MNIRIKRLELTNFKCFRNKEFAFNDDVTTIKGRNGVGKTTIADAILWCLFGKNSAGQTTFDLKTHDEHGNPIPHIEHAVEMELHIVNGSTETTITLKRTLKETWIKKRGATEETLKGHTTEYLVNGDVITAKDYEKYISSLISEDIFRAITNPAYFPSLKWQEQRDFLTKMVGTIAPEEIATTDELANLVKSLDDTTEGVDIIAHRKHLAHQIKQVKEKLDKIPVRLEEQNKALPELLDWEAITIEAGKWKDELEKAEQKILAIRSGDGQDVRKEAMRKELDELYDEKNKLEQELNRETTESYKKIDEKITALSQDFNSQLNTQRDLETSIKSFDTLITRCRENAEETFKTEQAYIREHWSETQIDFHNTDGGICPVCHQTLPDDMMHEAEAKFNQHKAELKRQLTERADKAKQLLAEAEKQAKDYEQQKTEAEKQLAQTKEKINTTFADKQKAEKEKAEIPTLEQRIADSLRRKQLDVNIADLKREIESAAATTDEDAKMLEMMKMQKISCTEQLSALNAQLSTKTQYERIQSLIDGIQKEQKELVAQLSELEQKEDVARLYQDRLNAILEERINQHFSLVKWRMFRTVNNAGDPFQEPYCECYVNGSAYHDGLNQAARLNAGLDIINTLCKHYNVYAPIVLDNAESTISIIETSGQQIRLQVSDTDLQIL